MIYDLFWNNCLVHDSFPMHNCWSGRQDGNRPNTREVSVGFPTTRKDWNDFVGQVFDENDVTVDEHVEVLRKVIE